MKKLVFISILLTLTLETFSQTYKSRFTIKEERKAITEMVGRSITITDKKITITNFGNGSKESLVLNINKIEEKEDAFDGKCKYYYCTTTDKDPVNGYQKAILIKKNDEITLGLFATEIDIYLYHLYL